MVNIIYGMMKNKTEYVMPAIPLMEAVLYNDGSNWLFIAIICINQMMASQLG